MENEFRYLEFEGIQIAAVIEGHNKEEHTEYSPKNILFFVEQGQLHIRSKQKIYTITKGNFGLVRKYEELSYAKNWTEEEEYAVVKALALQDELIHNAIAELGYQIPNKIIKDPVIELGENSILRGLYESLTLYLNENQNPDKQLMYLKTKEALLGIIQSSSDHLALFHEISKPVKANLKEFMQHHIFTNHTLVELAKLSGRSLSTFHRDFKKFFKASPHRWLLMKRLEKAYEILSVSSRRPSEIYLELGFKDFGHFSRSFKKAFDISPSKVGNKSA